MRDTDGKVIVVPSTLGLPAKATHKLLGKASADTYEWYGGVVLEVSPDIDMAELRRASTASVM